MKIPVVDALLRRKARSRIRRLMRGYRALKKTDQLGKISEIKSDFTNTVILKCKGRVSQHIFGAGIKNAELIIRQYLLIRIAGLEFNKAILYSIGKAGSKVVHPLPAEWQNILKQHSVEVAVFRSSLMWYGYIVVLFIYGIITFIKSCSKKILILLRMKSQETLGRYVYFMALSKDNLPQDIRDGQSHDIISWYENNIGRSRDISTLCHGVLDVPLQKLQNKPVTYIPSPVPYLCDYKQVLLFIKWGAGAISLSFIDILRGRWWHAVLLSESVITARTRLQIPDRLAQDYLFHNSNWIYRPLWTYEAEKLGSRILFYFYSTNVESFLKPDGSKSITYGWQASSWPNIFVWDDAQINFIRNEVGNTSAKISVVGPIWFSASEKKLDKLQTAAIAVFDVQPVRESFYQTLGIDFEYYISSTAKQFLHDIYSALNSNKITLALKRKRKISNLAHPKYRYFVESLERRAHYIAIDPDIAASQVIKESVAVISMPYTSTALLGREQGKPSVYYDPFSQCQKEDPAAHGIEVLSGYDELQAWVISIVNSNKANI